MSVIAIILVFVLHNPCTSDSTDVESDFSLDDILKPNGKNSEVTEAHKFAHVSSIAII